MNEYIKRKSWSLKKERKSILKANPEVGKEGKNILKGNSELGKEEK